MAHPEDATGTALIEGPPPAVRDPEPALASIRTFLAVGPSRVERIRTALSAGDLGDARRGAEELGREAGALGALDLACACARLRQACGGSPGAIPLLSGALARRYEETAGALEGLLVFYG